MLGARTISDLAEMWAPHRATLKHMHALKRRNPRAAAALREHLAAALMRAALTVDDAPASAVLAQLARAERTPNTVAVAKAAASIKGGGRRATPTLMDRVIATFYGRSGPKWHGLMTACARDDASTGDAYARALVHDDPQMEQWTWHAFKDSCFAHEKVMRRRAKAPISYGSKLWQDNVLSTTAAQRVRYLKHRAASLFLQPPCLDAINNRSVAHDVNRQYPRAAKKYNAGDLSKKCHRGKCRSQYYLDLLRDDVMLIRKDLSYIGTELNALVSRKRARFALTPLGAKGKREANSLLAVLRDVFNALDAFLKRIDERRRQLTGGFVLKSSVPRLL